MPMHHRQAARTDPGPVWRAFLKKRKSALAFKKVCPQQIRDIPDFPQRLFDELQRLAERRIGDDPGHSDRRGSF